MDIVNAGVGLIELAFFMPAIVMVSVCAPMLDDDAFRDVNVILFYTKLNAHTGDILVFVPATTAHDVDDVDIVNTEGSTIFIFPLEDSASIVVTTNVYDVIVFTTLTFILALPVTVLAEAVNVVVPSNFLYPFL